METTDKKTKRPTKIIKKKPKEKSSVEKHCCHYCYEKFPYLSRLEQHMKIHTDEQAYECSQCAARFKYPNSLRIHEKKHQRVKTFKCPDCSEVFNLRSDLTKHTITHKSPTEKTTVEIVDKCYKCEKCEMTFDDDVDFTLHKRTLEHINR